MVKHIVLFKLPDNINQEEKMDVMLKFKHAIEALPNVIKFIREIHVEININPDEKWDLCLNSDFDTLQDVKNYSINPAHIAAASILKKFPGERACVDYEY